MYGKAGNSGENSNGTVYPGGNFPGKNNTFRSITFFPFLPKQSEFSVPFVCITNARLQVERKRKIYRYFVNSTLNPVPVFGAKKIPVPFEGRFSPNSRTKNLYIR